MIAQTTYDWWLVPCELGAFPGIDSESKLYFEGKNYSEPSSEEFEHSEDLKKAIDRICNHTNHQDLYQPFLI